MVDVGNAVRQPNDLPFQCVRKLIPGMAYDPHSGLIGEVQSLPVFLQNVHHTERLLIVAKWLSGHITERLFSCVAKGCVAQIMTKGNGLCEILIEPQRPGNGAGDPHHFQRVGQPCPVVIALRLQEHLCLVLQPSEGFAVHDPIHIPLIAGADFIFLRRPEPASGLICSGSPGG